MFLLTAYETVSVLDQFEPILAILVFPALIFAMWAQWRVSASFRKYSQEEVTTGMTGREAAEEVLRQAGISGVTIERVEGHLTDHFDPRDNVIRLSEAVYDKATVAAVGVAAHEAGHAIQYAEDYGPMRVRAAIIPATTMGSKLSIPLIIIGALMGMVGLINLGIILFGVVVIFQLVTLPVEFNASARAMYALEGGNIRLTPFELEGSRKVLSAAALTYVAALAVSLAQLLRFLVIARRN